MKAREDIVPVSRLKSRTADLLSQVNKTHRPVVVTQNGVARAIIQDPESYERMRTAIGLLKLTTQGEADVEAGNLEVQDALFSRLEKKLKKSGSENAQSPDS